MRCDLWLCAAACNCGQLFRTPSRLQEHLRPRSEWLRLCPSKHLCLIEMHCTCNFIVGIGTPDVPTPPEVATESAPEVATDAAPDVAADAAPEVAIATSGSAEVAVQSDASPVARARRSQQAAPQDVAFRCLEVGCGKVYTEVPCRAVVCRAVLLGAFKDN